MTRILFNGTEMMWDELKMDTLSHFLFTLDERTESSGWFMDVINEEIKWGYSDY